MTHFLVQQLRFARAELQRCLEGLSDEDARKRLLPMNCISWMVGHLALQEQFYWVSAPQGREIAPDLPSLVGFGQPASTPPLADMWQVWAEITAAADPYLDTLTPALMGTRLEYNGKPLRGTIGTMLLRNIHHYWFHIGEAHAVRQQLGHLNLPDFVGSMSGYGYQPEASSS